MNVKNIISHVYLILCLALLPASHAALAAPLKGIPDGAIDTAIEREFVSDSSIDANFIDVQTADGIVTLSGKVDNLLARKRAVALAMSIKGVKSVVDEMRVIPEKRSDEEVGNDLTKTLANDTAIDHSAIKARSEGGVATLTGTVSSWPQKRLVETVAEGVRGVGTMNDEIVVKPTKKLTDEQLSAHISHRLDFDAQLEGTAIKVDVKDGNAHLSGIVGSAAEKARAAEDAMMAGATAVKDMDLVVDSAGWEKMRRANPPVAKTDTAIESALAEAFLDDPRVSASQTRATVSQGIVTLSGVVDNLRAKKAAEEDARDTTGVWGVENYIKVRPVDIPSDSEMITRAKEALLRNSLTASQHIKVFAIHGIVYLSGIVESEYGKEIAAEVAYQTPGVIDVENNLIVGPEAGVASMSDWEIKENIERRFDFSPRLDSSRIKVSVMDGVATLDGAVDNLVAGQTALNLAHRAGARRIRDELTIKNGPH